VYYSRAGRGLRCVLLLGCSSVLLLGQERQGEYYSGSGASVSGGERCVLPGPILQFVAIILRYVWVMFWTTYWQNSGRMLDHISR